MSSAGDADVIHGGEGNLQEGAVLPAQTDGAQVHTRARCSA